MSTFDKREKAYEDKFARDEELLFRAKARRNRLLGLWAAEQLGKSGEDADNYAREVIRSDMKESGDEDVFRKLREDFNSLGIGLSDHQIRRVMEELMEQARQQIESGT